MLPLTPEQQQALQIDARIAVVTAGPGSGKTRLFIEAVQKYLQVWADQRAGLAALSFTNVAQNEIAARMGGHLGAPHFVGTLDSFMLRFVVRPFAHLVNASPAGIRLIPSPLDRQMRFPEVKIGSSPRDTVSIFQVRFNQGVGPSTTFRYTDRMGRNSNLPAQFCAATLSKKQALWKNSGLMTHSDTHYLAAVILESFPSIAKLIARRFPVLLVDELQDTSWFLGRGLVELLKVPTVRGMVVGDPDQAIYEFGGANPHIFSVIEGLDGAKAFPLTTSQRCASKICAVASVLTDSGKQVVPKTDAEEGRAVMLVHSLDKPVPDSSLIQCIGTLTSGAVSLAVLARRNQTISRLTGEQQKPIFPGHSRLARAIDHACVQLNAGQADRASKTVSKELYDLAFDDESFSRRKLLARGIQLHEWKKHVYMILSSAAESKATTWNDWISDLRASMEAELKLLTGKTFTLGTLLKKDSASLRGPGSPTVVSGSWPRTFPLSTVHQAKGREFSAVIYFQPKPHARHDPCPSSQWFAAGNEERRIAYVAATRAMNVFTLCVHEQTYQNLRASQPSFVDLFEVALLGDND